MDPFENIGNMCDTRLPICSLFEFVFYLSISVCLVFITGGIYGDYLAIGIFKKWIIKKFFVPRIDHSFLNVEFFGCGKGRLVENRVGVEEPIYVFFCCEKEILSLETSLLCSQQRFDQV